MKIAINLLPFDLNLAGTGVYIRNLLNFFGDLSPDNEFHLFVRHVAANNFSYNYSNYIIHSYDINTILGRILFEQTIFVKELYKYEIDKLFVPSVVKPIFYYGDTTITVHDMIPYKVKEKYGFWRKNYIKLMTYLSTKTANKIITISKSSLIDIKEIYHIDSEKITVIYNGLDANKVFVGKNEKRDQCTAPPYMLYVGTIEPGKNILTTIKVFEVLKKDIEGLKLILVGKKTPYIDGLMQYIFFNKLENDVVFAGFVTDEKLANIYKNALLFIYISFYEGFGLPVLEAMGNRIPVVTSNISSLPEVVGKNGCVVDPFNISEIAQKCHLIAMDKNFRDNLILEQTKQLKNFRWDVCAKKTLDVILNG